ncbi:MAG: hypothetical protein CBC00_10335 [Verrucomicrobia bacterium TMED40]|jgi:hypothetical protein|nr:MAG: hypothetical protein CBC00_10335 [Verrucomicrobia bacterium TMED40]|tara:strand:+ start:645 stop:959 length:315 start_codon:yes stop_codon:yes gene_type:complete
MMVRIWLPLFCLTYLQLSCSQNVSEVVEDWKQKGWSKVAFHGVASEFIRHGKLMHEKAQSVEASWIQNGVRKTKLYRQSNHHYLMLRFFKKNKDEFVVVMRKRK